MFRIPRFCDDPAGNAAIWTWALTFVGVVAGFAVMIGLALLGPETLETERQINIIGPICGIGSWIGLLAGLYLACFAREN